MGDTKKRVGNEFTVTIPCDSVDAFLTELSPRKERYCSVLPREWLYRGVSDDQKYDLTPTALREGSLELSKLTGHKIVMNREQCHAERQVLIDFLRIADSVGLHIPEDTQELRSMLHQGAVLPKEWPPTGVLSAMALARHHGVPARLLDWSRHPFKAAWFAAIGAVDSADKLGFLSVWALCADPARVSCGVPLPFTVITAPSATNSNLRAQEGVFTAAKPIYPNGELVDRRPFDELLQASIDELRIKVTGPWFYKITLPQRYADDLLFALALEGVTRAALFPNFDGVAREMRDISRLYWTDGAPGDKRIKDFLLNFSLSHESDISYSELLSLTHPPPPAPHDSASTIDIKESTIRYRVAASQPRSTWEFSNLPPM